MFNNHNNHCCEVKPIVKNEAKLEILDSFEQIADRLNLSIGDIKIIAKEMFLATTTPTTNNFNY